MHRSDICWSVGTLLGALLACAGCRWQGYDGHVQISPGPRTFSKEVEPPKSRLAGGSKAEGASALRPASEGGPGDGGQTVILAGAEVPQSSAAATGSAVPADATLTESERQALVEAFRDASPEIRALAEHQVAALAAQEAKPKKSLVQETAATEEPSPQSAADAAAAAAADAPPAEGGATSDAPAADTSAAAETAIAEAKPTDGQGEETGAEDQTVDIRQAVSEGEDKKNGSVKTASAIGTATEAGPDPLAALSDEQLFQHLIARYEKRLQDETRRDSATGDLVTLRTLTTLAGNPDSAVTPVEGWNPSEQEFLNYQMLALWQMVDPQAHPTRGQRWTMALPELRQATNHLAASTGNLDVRGLSFCTEVESYGRIRTFPANRFTAGQQVILYSELENFVAERLSDGYETHLRGTYEIFDAAGQRVADQVLPEDRQTCNNYRRDYFIAYQLYLPNRLVPGNYRLELTMEDLKGKKYGQASIPLEIIK